jgi:hypothetical protein
VHKRIKNHPVILAFLLFASFSMGALFFSGSAVSPAFALPPSDMGSYVVSSTQSQNGQTDTIVVVDSIHERMMVYKVTREGNMKLIAVRNMQYDRKFQEFSAKGRSQSPTVKEAKKLTGG